MAKKVRVHHFAEKKQTGEPIVMLTAYDAMTAKIFDDAGVDSILVGDSYGTTMLGYPSTIPVDMDDMCRATAAVARGAQRPFIIADMPLGASEASDTQAVENAIVLLKAGAEAVKVEGGVARAHTIRALVDAGINVCGHIGYTPQSINALGGPRVQGRGDGGYEKLRADALAVQEAGAFAVVFEMVPAPLAEKITAELTIPTIGIGAGNVCDGQVLVWTDMAGMTDWQPSFVKRFGEVGEALRSATETYCAQVRSRAFPDPEHTFDK